MLITLKKWQKIICENPKVLISEEPWNKFDELIICGKCPTCKKNKLILEGKYKNEKNAIHN